MDFKKIVLSAGIGLMSMGVFAQETQILHNKEGGGYDFTVVKEIDRLDVQNQNRTGTCWSFSALSFIESELLRMGKGQHNLSEMYIARYAYSDKIANYVRMHGNFNLGPGGAFHDIPYVIKRHGIVPEEVYSGRPYGQDQHNHAEMDAVLKAMADVVIDNPQRTLTDSWKNATEAALDAYLGKAPEKFTYKGKEYTPQSYAKELGLNMDDYIIITSFTHHPFYSQFVLEIPDNWAFGTVYNVPLDELVEITDNALNKGYGVAWASDVSEKGFSFRDGLAIVPENEEAIQKRGSDNRNFSDAGAMKVGSPFDSPAPEKKITQEMRQKAFDNYETTDDHGMHFVGMVNDQDGKKYYMVKNSWGTANDCGGYFYASEAFFKYKTTNVMVHKDAVPKAIAKKLKLK